MKKSSKKLSLKSATIRNLQGAIGLVAGGIGSGDVSAWYACPSDETCGDSHRATCGDGSRCATLNR
jgi:hypothetical protein